jgi:glycosyltransferase involved in cell wall biosynthesis
MCEVSIIITTFNRPEWLKIAIESAINQNFSKKEIIVVDDGSAGEETNLLVRDYPFVKYIYQKNQGLGVARNTGLAASKGYFIQFLDDDDWLEANSCSEKINIINQKPDLSAVYSDLYITNQEGQVISKYFQNYKGSPPTGDIYERIIVNNFIPVHSPLWRKSIIENLGGFATRSGHEDWELIIQAAVNGKFDFIDKPLGYYRLHQKNMSKSFKVMITGKLALHETIVNSERFDSLPGSIKINLLLKYSLQQYAFGSQGLANKYYSLALKGEERNQYLRVVTRILLNSPRLISKSLLLLNHNFHKIHA